MPKFHFVVRVGPRFVADPEGEELPDVAAAEAHARDVARELMARCEAGRRHWKIEVHDANGAVVVDLLFAAVDPALDHLEPRTRDEIVRLADSIATAGALMRKSKLIIWQSEPFATRSARKPRLVAAAGRQR
jgi:hypothetical protein